MIPAARNAQEHPRKHRQERRQERPGTQERPPTGLGVPRSSHLEVRNGGTTPTPGSQEHQQKTPNSPHRTLGQICPNLPGSARTHPWHPVPTTGEQR